MDASKVIKEFLNKNSWTQDYFAKKCRISDTAVWRYMQGKPISRKVAEKISRVTGIPYEKITEMKRKKKKGEASS